MGVSRRAEQEGIAATGRFTCKWRDYLFLEDQSKKFWPSKIWYRMVCENERWL